MQCIVTCAAVCTDSYLQPVLGHKCLIPDTYHPDTLDLRKQGYEDQWLFCEAKRIWGSVVILRSQKDMRIRGYFAKPKGYEDPWLFCEAKKDMRIRGYFAKPKGYEDQWLFCEAKRIWGSVVILRSQKGSSSEKFWNHWLSATTDTHSHEI